MTNSKYHPKYVQRLATVYMDKHRDFGYDVAVLWYHQFVPHDLKEAVKLQVHQLVAGLPKDGGKK